MSSPRAFIRTGTGRGTLGVALLAGGLQIALHNRGIWIEDEGIVLETAARVARGEVLYRDVAAVILPGVFWVHAALFRLFGEGILPGRWAMVALFTAVCLLVYRYLARAAGDRVAWLGLGLILGFRLLAFPTWTIPNYTHWSLLFLILGLWLLQGYPASRSRRRLLALGAVAGLGVVFKQNYGAITLAVAFVGVAALEPRPLRIRRLGARLALVTAGCCLVTGMVLLLVAAQGGFRDLVAYVMPFLSPTNVEAWFHLPFPGPSQLGRPDAHAFFTYFPSFLFPLVTGAHDPFFTRPEVLAAFQGAVYGAYYLPPLTFLVAAAHLVAHWRCLGESARATWVPLLVAAVLLYASIFYRPDWIHLANGLLPTLLLWALLLGAALGRPPTSRTGRLARALAIGGGTVAAAALAGLSLGAIIRANPRYVGGPRAGVWVGESEFATIEASVPFLRAKAAAGEPAVFLGHQRILPFLAGQLGRYPAEFWLVFVLRPDEARRLGEALVRDRPPWIVYTETPYLNSLLTFTDFGRPLLEAIAPHYRFTRTLEDQFIVLGRVDARPTADPVAFDFLDARGTAEAAVEDVATGQPRLTAAAAAARVVVGWWLLEPQLAVDVQADRVRLEYPQISVPEHARVRFTLSVNPALWRAPFSQGVRFRLLGRDGARKVVFLDRSIDPWQRPEDRAPQPVDLDLGPLAGTAVRFTWVTESIAPSVLPLPRAGWGRPQLVVAERRCAG